jgi:glycosyltransferase involved in cell wall biosynthesis
MSDTQPDQRLIRIALLIPTVELGGYWRPVITELAKISERVILYTGRPWAGFDPEDPETKYVEVVGEIVRVTKNEAKTDYSGGYMKLSTKITDRLLEFKPQVIIVSGFSMWTILALLFKPVGGWKVVLAWEGSSPNVDFRNSKSRILMRNLLAKFADTFITNSAGGKAYLVDYLKVDGDNIQIRPYLVPDPKTLLSLASTAGNVEVTAQSPVFLYVGRIEERKGLHLLLQACHLLRQQGAKFSLLVIGRGPQQDELKAYCQTHDLDDCVQWLGWIDYRQLGLYFDRADVFMFPSLEDTWGMVALEAMAFGKPVLCSKWAGVSELITDGKSGFICDPKDTVAMAGLMQQSIERPELITAMGIAATEAISHHTPAAVAQFLADVSLQTLK